MIHVRCESQVPFSQPSDSFQPIARHPPVHCLPGHPITLGDLNNRDTGKDLQHGPVSLLDHIQLPKHERERRASSGATVSHIKRSRTPVPTPRV